MRVAVLSLTRDRLWSTRECFTLLRDLAGCPFDHYVLDQGSGDGTEDWLRDVYQPKLLVEMRANVGVSRGINTLLNGIDLDAYDVVVKFDNDCVLTTPDTLKTAASLVMAHPEWILSPHILGLNDPVQVSHEEELDGVRVGVIGRIGGVFMAAPSSLYKSYRHDESNPIWGMDDVQLGGHWQQSGGRLGYLLDFPARHDTQAQAAKDPVYYARKMAEFNG